MSSEASLSPSQQLFRIVRVAMAQATSAEHKFESANASIQHELQMMELMRDHSTSKIAEIVMDAKQACDELYKSYQMQIRNLDNEGRALLTNGVNRDAVCEVQNAIRHFNEESKISNNYSASLNGVSMGQFATVQYLPTAEGLAIQAFWDAAVTNPAFVTSTSPTPPLAEDTPEAKAERTRLLQEKRRMQREYNEAKYAAAKADFAQKEAAAKAKYNEVVQVAETWKSRFQRELNTLAEGFRQKYSGETSARLSYLETEKQRLTAELNKLGAFQMGKKKELRAALETISREQAYLQDPGREAAALGCYFSDANTAAQAYASRLQTYLNNRFPKFNSTEKDMRPSVSVRPESEPVSLEELNDVYEALKSRKQATAQQLMDDVPWYDPRRVHQILRGLQGCFSAETRAEGGITFYQATDLAPVEPVPAYHAPINRYEENPNAANLPIPSPESCAPSWWYPSEPYGVPAEMKPTEAVQSADPADQQIGQIPQPKVGQRFVSASAPTAPVGEKRKLGSKEKQEAILAALRKKGAMRVSDMAEQIPELAGESPQRVLVYCRALRIDGLIASETRDHTTYFHV